MPFQSANVTKSVALAGPGSREAKITVVISDTSTVAGQEIVIIDAGRNPDQTDPFPNTFGHLSLTKQQFDSLIALVAAVVTDARQGVTPG